MEKKFELAASEWGHGGSQNSRSGFKHQPGIYRLRMAHKLKSSTISPGQETIPRARMVGTGSEGDTCSGLLKYSILVRYIPHPHPRALWKHSSPMDRKDLV